MKPPTSLEIDVDTRIAGMWDVVWQSELLSKLDSPTLRTDLGILLRSAYSLGYRDALTEVANGHPGKLLVDNNVILT